MTRGRGKKAPSPSRLPTPVWRRKEGKRLRRRSEGEQPDIDQSGTDHSPPISLPSLSQSSPQQVSPALQSPQFGRLDTADCSDPWSVFSPRPQGADKVQSAPSSPSGAVPSPLVRTVSVSSTPTPSGLQSELVGIPYAYRW